MGDKNIFQALKKNEHDPIGELVKNIKVAVKNYNKTNNARIKIDVNEVEYSGERKICSIV